MGTLSGGNGDNRPPEGPGVPGLPPEWGSIVVPDDPSELAEEAAGVRRELRRRARQEAWRRRRRWPSARRITASPVAPAAMLIMLLAILATLTSLFTFARPSPRTGPAAGSDAPTVPAPQAGAVPALDLVDAGGTAVPLRRLLPAAILVVDGCACAELIAATAAAAPRGVTVVVVAATAPSNPPGLARVRTLADPAGDLRSLVPEPRGGTASVLLVSDSAEIVHTVPSAGSIAPYEAELAALATR